MPVFTPARPRRFPSLHASDDLTIVVPDSMTDHDAVRRVAETLELYGDCKPRIVPHNAFDESMYRNGPLVACGNLTDNAVMARLYRMRCSFVDTFFPGDGGYFVKSVSDPFGFGYNVITVGASGVEHLAAALGAFESVIHTQEGDLTRVHAHRLPFDLPAFPDPDRIDEMIRADLALWSGDWSASPFRGGQVFNCLWYFYLTDHPGWGKAIPPIFEGSIALFAKERVEHPESYHTFFGLHHFIHLWDLVEDSPFYDDAARKSVATMFCALLDHLAGLFYLRPDVTPPGEPRQNHATFIGLDLAAGHDYLTRRYDFHGFDVAMQAVDRIFDGQGDSYKPNDDAGVGYAWLTPFHTFLYFMYKNDNRYLRGPIADLCRLAVLTVDNMRSEAGYGDTSGYADFSATGWPGHLWPLMVSTWATRNPEHLWTLNWLGKSKRPSLVHALHGLYAGVRFTDEGFSLEGVDPVRPDGLTGIQAMRLPDAGLRWVERNAPETHRPVDSRVYFDKIALRTSFDPEDEYLLLDGAGTFCHGHEDANAIVRLTWRNRAWLADGDYIRAAPKYHNAIVVLRDGQGVLDPPGDGVTIPPLASLVYRQDSPAGGLLMTEAAGYNGVDWQRHIFWGKGRYLLVVDRLRATVVGDYRCRCLWRLVGTPEQNGSLTRLHQQGVDFFIHNLDAIPQTLIDDDHPGSRWSAYPYATGPIHVLHQTVAKTLEPGEDIRFVNLFTPHPDITAQRLSAGLVKIEDGDTVTVLGVGTDTLGTVTIEGTLYTLTASRQTLAVHGIERFGHPVPGGVTIWERFDRAPAEIPLAASPIARHLKTAMTVRCGIPYPGFYPVDEPISGGLVADWSMATSGVSALDATDTAVLCGGEDGTATLFSATGAVMWRFSAGQPVTATKLAMCDGIEVAMIGTAESTLIALDTVTGQERWRRTLKNISARGAAVTAIATADLYGDGHSAVVAGTAGWFVNAFVGDGTPLWATWVRYHPITRLIVEDADGDGRGEVMVGNVYSTPLTVHHADGSFRWSTLEQVGAEGNATTPRRGNGLTHMTLIDVDGDGLREIVYGTEDGWIYAVSPQEGAERWRLSVAGEVAGLAATPDGIATATEFGLLYRLAWDGSIRWYAPVANRIHTMAVVGDQTVSVAEDRLLRHDPTGRSTGSLPLPAKVLFAHPVKNSVICALADGTVVRIRCV
ncbi:MAG: PQQ-binding-like beta-propeller repeat protein [candidate division Zixibacteria bacterium]|nr:PQQ-binding-like beta-propeller repeat protein [candidate division Zixibacteria bacterium]